MLVLALSTLLSQALTFIELIFALGGCGCDEEIKVLPL